MGKLTDFLAGIKTLEVIESPINGKVTVVKSIAFGIYIQVSGLTQSGGILKNIWGKTLKVVKNQKEKVNNCLVLGLGGGSIIEVIKKYWEDSKVTAVDIDPLMVKLGTKYLKFDDNQTKVVISDAAKFVAYSFKRKKTYELICVDLYVGDKFPEKFESLIFLKNLKKILVNGGTCVINRLYYGNKRPEAMKFLTVLEKIFSKVQVIYPEANVMFVCSK